MSADATKASSLSSNHAGLGLRLRLQHASRHCRHCSILTPCTPGKNRIMTGVTGWVRWGRGPSCVEADSGAQQGPYAWSPMQASTQALLTTPCVWACGQAFQKPCRPCASWRKYVNDAAGRHSPALCTHRVERTLVYLLHALQNQHGQKATSQGPPQALA
jgi:hypothetical protein